MEEANLRKLDGKLLVRSQPTDPGCVDTNGKGEGNASFLTITGI